MDSKKGNAQRRVLMLRITAETLNATKQKTFLVSTDESMVVLASDEKISEFSEQHADINQVSDESAVSYVEENFLRYDQIVEEVVAFFPETQTFAVNVAVYNDGKYLPLRSCAYTVQRNGKHMRFLKVEDATASAQTAAQALVNARERRKVEAQRKVDAIVNSPVSKEAQRSKPKPP